MVPSGPCRIVGFVENVGAIPSTCGNDGASIAKNQSLKCYVYPQEEFKNLKEVIFSNISFQYLRLKFRLIDAATSPNVFFDRIL